MDLRLPDVAAEFAVAAHRAFRDDLGGVDIARTADDDPSVRRTDVAPVLEKLGVSDLTSATVGPWRSSHRRCRVPTMATSSRCGA
jgi:hypothetical protein